MIFIYSFIDGETKQAADGPTKEDLIAVEDGQLEVLKVVIEGGEEEPPYLEVFTVNGQGHWEATAEAECLCTHGQEWHE